MGKIIFIAYIWLLYKFSNVDKVYLWFALVLGLVIQFGYFMGMIELLVWMLIARVTRDMIRA